MLTKELLERYLRQNPRKYAVKFGSKSPDEVLAGLNPQPEAVDPSPVKVEVSEAKDVEVGFTQPVDPAIQQEVEQRIEAKKRGRKPNAQ